MFFGCFFLVFGVGACLRVGEAGGAVLCNQYVHWDNSYLVFNREGVHSDVLAQL